MPGVGGLDGDLIMSSIQLPATRPPRPPWNKGRLIGQKRPLLPRQVWAIRARLELADNLRDLALFNLAIDSKLRGCDLVRLKVADLVVGASVRDRVSVIQSKIGRSVQFDVSQNTQRSLVGWVKSPPCLVKGFSSPAGSTPHPISRRDSTPVSSATGSAQSGLIPADMARIHYDERRLR